MGFLSKPHAFQAALKLKLAFVNVRDINEQFANLMANCWRQIELV